MEMKDKLVKNHHKGSYYRARQTFIGMGISAALLAIVAVPTYISLHATQVQKLNAQPETETENGSDDQNSEYQSYADAE